MRWILCAVYLLSGFFIEQTSQLSVETDLVVNLTSSYEVNARPVARPTDAVAVQVGVALQQIIELNEPTQILMTNIYLRIYWKDESLSWDPADYSNVTSVRLSVDRIWRPDITLYNDVSTERRDVEELYPAIVTHDGSVAWLSPTIFISSCTLNMRYFPWDSQNCKLELGSWSYDSSAIALAIHGEAGDISPFIENGEWELEGMPAELISALYACCPHPYESIIFTIQVKRKPMYYLINIVLPCIFVSFVGLLTFLLPPTSGEKVSLAVTVLLASTVFLLIVAEALPPQSTSVPLVSQYFEAVMFLLALATVVTVFVINIHHRGEIYSRPPRIIRVLFLDYLSRLACIHNFVTDAAKNKYTLNRANFEGCHVSDLNSNALHCQKLQVNGLDQPSFCQRIKSHAPADVNTVTDLHDLDAVPTTDSILQDILTELKGMRLEKDNLPTSDVTEGSREWIIIAMVLDRLFLVIFAVVTLVTSVTILLHR